MKTPPTWEDSLKEFWRLKKSTHTVISLPMWERFIGSILTAHEATIRQEIGEKVEKLKTGIRHTHMSGCSDCSTDPILERVLAILANK